MVYDSRKITCLKIQPRATEKSFKREKTYVGPICMPASFSMRGKSSHIKWYIQKFPLYVVQKMSHKTTPQMASSYETKIKILLVGKNVDNKRLAWVMTLELEIQRTWIAFSLTLYKATLLTQIFFWRLILELGEWCGEGFVGGGWNPNCLLYEHT